MWHVTYHKNNETLDRARIGYTILRFTLTIVISTTAIIQIVNMHLEMLMECVINSVYGKSLSNASLGMNDTK